jgi:hypothetical protein
MTRRAQPLREFPAGPFHWRVSIHGGANATLTDKVPKMKPSLNWLLVFVPAAVALRYWPAIANPTALFI